MSSSTEPHWNVDVSLTEIKEQLNQLEINIYQQNFMLRFILDYIQTELISNKNNISVSSCTSTSSTPQHSVSSQSENTQSITHTCSGTDPIICWYHRRYGIVANKCKPPCIYYNN